ncbi:MAG: diaminopimelate epimerase [Acidimicrobiales bacterium]
MSTATFFKYHGTGNDFLVLLDPRGVPGDGELDAGFVRLICDRKRGLGADGVVVARPPSGEGFAARMELRNADGGRAETSGNGLSCMALALACEQGRGTELAIETVAGPRRCHVAKAPPEGHSAVVTVEMGTLRLGAEVALSSLGPAFGGARPAARVPDGIWMARPVDAGNPHLVLLGGSLDDLDISLLGPELEVLVEGGQNVEAAAVSPGGGLLLAIWERGAGRTQACGSGSCAAAATARAAGLVDERVEVHNEGGALLVELEGPVLSPEATLSTTATRVARIEIELDGFAGPAAP